jgi:hypothetical protein
MPSVGTKVNTAEKIQPVIVREKRRGFTRIIEIRSIEQAGQSIWFLSRGSSTQFSLGISPQARDRNVGIKIVDLKLPTSVKIRH